VAAIDVVVLGQDRRRIDRIVADLRSGGLTAEAAPFGRAVAVLTSPRSTVVVVDGFPTAPVLGAIADGAAAHPERRVLVLGHVDPELDVLVVVASGADGYLPPDVDAPTLVRAVRTLLAGEVVFPATIATALVDRVRLGDVSIVRRHRRPVTLTNRELDVLVLVRQARTTADIARLLATSQAAIGTLVATVLRKLGAGSRAAVTAAARIQRISGRPLDAEAERPAEGGGQQHRRRQPVPAPHRGPAGRPCRVRRRRPGTAERSASARHCGRRS
jgi:DNA-binding NarL/FixJ family response regulator